MDAILFVVRDTIGSSWARRRHRAKNCAAMLCKKLVRMENGRCADLLCCSDWIGLLIALAARGTDEHVPLLLHEERTFGQRGFLFFCICVCMCVCVASNTEHTCIITHRSGWRNDLFRDAVSVALGQLKGDVR